MSERKSSRQEGMLLRPSFANRSGMGPATHGPPEGRALEEWLSDLGQLRSSAELDRSILDSVHQDLTRSPRSPPVLLLGVTLSCVVFGAMGKFHPGQSAPGPMAVHAPAEPVRLLAKNVYRQGPEVRQAAVKKPLLGSVRPLGTYRPRAKSTLASRGSVTPAMGAIHPIRLAAAPPPPLAATPIVPSQPSAVGADAEVRPTSTGISAALPPVPLTNSLSFSGARLAVAPIKLQERLDGMVSPTGLLANLPQPRDSSHRPLYKRAWFVGMLGVAATGLAAGVTAAVVSSQQTTHGTSGQPITIALGPT